MSKDKENSDVFDSITEIFGFIQIAASPIAIALFISFFVVKSMPGTIGFVIAGIITTLGLLIGILWAINVAKTKGTVNFMSKVSGTSELDDKDTEKEKVQD